MLIRIVTLLSLVFAGGFSHASSIPCHNVAATREVHCYYEKGAGVPAGNEAQRLFILTEFTEEETNDQKNESQQQRLRTDHFGVINLPGFDSRSVIFNKLNRRPIQLNHLFIIYCLLRI